VSIVLVWSKVAIADLEHIGVVSMSRARAFLKPVLIETVIRYALPV
jgi:hypothetical protein